MPGNDRRARRKPPMKASGPLAPCHMRALDAVVQANESGPIELLGGDGSCDIRLAGRAYASYFRVTTRAGCGEMAV